MREISIGNVHLDLGAGRRGVDMGPSAIHYAGLKQGIEGIGHRVAANWLVTIPSQEMAEVGNPHARFLKEIAEACRKVADRVEASLEQGMFPVVLGGDHSVAIGTISGLARFYRRQGKRIGVLWADAHTDVNTPDTSPSGNIHGMPLAVLLGYGPPELTSIAGDEPALRAEDVAVIGARDVDLTEKSMVRRTGIRVYTMSELDERGTAVCIREAIDHISAHTGGVHLSFDMDGCDPQDAPGVGTPVPGGLNLRESHLLCEKMCQTGRLVGVEMVELNPVLDTENKTGKLAVWLILSALGKAIL